MRGPGQPGAVRAAVQELGEGCAAGPAVPGGEAAGEPPGRTGMARKQSVHVRGGTAEQFVAAHSAQVHRGAALRGPLDDVHPPMAVDRVQRRGVEVVVERVDAVEGQGYGGRGHHMVFHRVQRLHRAARMGDVVAEDVVDGGGVGDGLRARAGGGGDHRGGVDAAQVGADEFAARDPCGDRVGEALSHQPGAFGERQFGRGRAPAAARAEPAVAVEQDAPVTGDDVDAAPDRLGGQRVEDSGTEQVHGQARLVQVRARHVGQDVGTVTDEVGAVGAGRLGGEDAADAGDGAADQRPAVETGDQVVAAGPSARVRVGGLE
ncbi:hypothetical protein RKD47_000005 [Streptomyces albogriseolus]